MLVSPVCGASGTQNILLTTSTQQVIAGPWPCFVLKGDGSVSCCDHSVEAWVLLLATVKGHVICNLMWLGSRKHGFSLNWGTVNIQWIITDLCYSAFLTILLTGRKKKQHKVGSIRPGLFHLLRTERGDVGRKGAQPLPTVSAVPKAPYSD